MFKCIIGSSFIFSPNDETWKIKRKAMAHAFYKDRLQQMLETLKVVILTTFAAWAAKVDQEGHHDVNMATEFSDILARNIIHICFGEDLSDDLIEYQVKDENGKWGPKTLDVKGSIFVVVNQITDRYLKCVAHPANWLYPHTRHLFTVDSDAKKVQGNCDIARNWVKSYV